ncbi:MAG: hypothetical protein R3Y28_02290 [Candidatus Gastranaerophilales bacterium]
MNITSNIYKHTPKASDIIIGAKKYNEITANIGENYKSIEGEFLNENNEVVGKIYRNYQNGKLKIQKMINTKTGVQREITVDKKTPHRQAISVKTSKITNDKEKKLGETSINVSKSADNIEIDRTFDVSIGDDVFQRFNDVSTYSTDPTKRHLNSNSTQFVTNVISKNTGYAGVLKGEWQVPQNSGRYRLLQGDESPKQLKSIGFNVEA